jgi:uncharacterized protein YdhG (YjbR/CyaY superfamily)
MKAYKSVNEYINQFPEDKLQKILRKMRATIRKIVPKAVETISYGIPTYKLNGKNVVHFGGFRDHVSLFPTSSPIPFFTKELAKYKTSKGTVQFGLDKPIPYPLIVKIVKFRVKQINERKK